MTKYIIIISTTDSKELAVKIADELLNKKLVACVNIVPGVQSRYWWKGKVNYADEYILLIKTAESLFIEVEEVIKKLHGYECPEIISTPIISGSEDYLQWLESSVKQQNK